MTLSARLIVALLLIAPTLTGNAKAMLFEDFARMNNDDEAAYVALLVESASKMLKASGKPDQASKVISFFKDSSKNGGVRQFAYHLKMMNVLNTRNANNPNNRVPVYQVEDAMESALRDDEIIVPAKYLLASSQDFHPSGLPRQQTISPQNGNEPGTPQN
jgi:hypothetical protein